MEEITKWLGNDFDTMTFRIIFAVMLCGIIGFERELKNHSAGFRTHILVGVGSCLMMLLSLYGFDQYLEKFDIIRFDPARIPSYVISGIGFLGAGTIMVHRMTIKGLTTAASIWVVAGLGLVIGAGLYSIAVLTTIVVLLSLIFLNHIEDKLFSRGKGERYIELKLKKNAQLIEILNVFEEMQLNIRRLEIENEKEDDRHLFIELDSGQHINQKDLLHYLSQLEHVNYVFEKK
ncbi:MgtC/SapB family protein [Salirhabdus sp. Marseille-P4669]|uniref:MgtC/SapB family protein n=1 Tax=Salirhabdus sp. Marseille-P4669 TaxID=2042310 RepID=UPI000C7A0112|nr:MgtC/SapB family protein [Salirhabdus sp. Marseille-P4669]